LTSKILREIISICLLQHDLSRLGGEIMGYF